MIAFSQSSLSFAYRVTLGIVYEKDTYDNVADDGDFISLDDSCLFSF